MSAHDTPEGRCFCVDCAPSPTIPLAEALRSPARRAERDRQLARWCRLPEDEVEGFVEYGRIYDLWLAARREEEAVARLRAAEDERARLEGVSAPSLRAPRIYAPRAE